MSATRLAGIAGTALACCFVSISPRRLSCQPSLIPYFDITKTSANDDVDLDESEQDAYFGGDRAYSHALNRNDDSDAEVNHDALFNALFSVMRSTAMGIRALLPTQFTPMDCVYVGLGIVSGSIINYYIHSSATISVLVSTYVSIRFLEQWGYIQVNWSKVDETREWVMDRVPLLGTVGQKTKDDAVKWVEEWRYGKVYFLGLLVGYKFGII